MHLVARGASAIGTLIELTLSAFELHTPTRGRGYPKTPVKEEGRSSSGEGKSNDKAIYRQSEVGSEQAYSRPWRLGQTLGSFTYLAWPGGMRSSRRSSSYRTCQTWMILSPQCWIHRMTALADEKRTLSLSLFRIHRTTALADAKRTIFLFSVFFCQFFTGNSAERV